MQQNESTFDGLIRLSKEVDFAVFVCGAGDVTVVDGEAAPMAAMIQGFAENSPFLIPPKGPVSDS